MMTTDETDIKNLQKQIDQIFESIKIQSCILLIVSELSKLNQFIEFNKLCKFNELFEFNNHRVENMQLRRRVNMIDDKSQEEMSQSLFMRD